MSGDGKSTVVDRPGSVPSQDRAEPAPPRRESRRRSVPPASRYESGDEIGRGGMGRVVEATDTLLDRRVAVKEALTTDPELLRRFARETKITARLEHPSIVPLYDAGTVDGAPFYVMRRVSGRPLSELIRAAPALNDRLALVPHLLAAAQAIAHAHQRGIIHRDIKPSNILVGELGETVVIDWGLAKVLGEPDDAPTEDNEPGASMSLRTRIGSVFGTPGFMDPNQLRGDHVGTQGDVYSLGASLYNLLAAEPPHYASDSTQMMKLASQGPAVPVSQRVAGVPAELSTIVDRATDYDTERRYKDAGQFAEELKRFLTGQLVASHEYSRAERFVRFVRKHRAAVAIGAAATILLVIVGTFALSQVIEERDRADAQARLATQGRREAEAARAMADERADLLLISRASALVETNPTAALASLKQLTPASKHIDDARAIALSARLRGVGWAMKAADTHPGVVVLDPAARRIAQMTVDGKLHVYDLETRRIVFETQLERGMQVRWIRDGKQLLVVGRGATRVFSPTGTEEKTDLPVLDSVETDERGVQLIAVDGGQRALRIDLERGTRTEIGTGVTAVQIDPEGTYFTVTTKTDFIVYDGAGKALLHRPHARSIVRASFGTTKIAVLDNARVYEAPLQAGASWALVPAATGQNVPLWLDYANDRLFGVFADSRVLAEYKGVLQEVGRMDSTTGTMHPFGRDYLAVGVDGRRIYYVDGAMLRTLYLPIAMRFVRVVTRAAHSRLVAIGDGAIVVLELDALPKLMPLERHQTTVFVSNTVLLSSAAFNYNYSWFDLTTQRSTHASTGGAVNMRTFDRVDGRMLATEQTTGGGIRALIFEAGGQLPSQVIDTPFEEIQLVTGGGLVYSIGNKVFGGYRGVVRPELFTTDGKVQILVRLGPDEFAAISDRELVRHNLRTNALVRFPLDDGPPINYAIPQGGQLLLARGDKLLRWHDSSLEVFATLESPANSMFVVETGVLATLSNHSAVFVDNAGKMTRLSSSRGDAFGSAHRVVVPGQFHYDVIELPSLARWGLPITRAADMADVQLDLSPDGKKLVEKRLDGRLWLWDLPIGEDLAQLVSQTNFVEDQNGLLLWPWQNANPTK